MRISGFSTIAAVMAMGVMAGCSSDASAPKTEEKETATAQPSGTTAELATCNGCQKQFPRAELAAHDGMLLCKTCSAAHVHE